MASEPIAFRPLRRDDFGRLATWLAEPRVARWWNHDVSPEAIERDFGTSVDGGDATEMFVVQLDGEPVGFIQRYPIGAYAEYVEELSRVCPVPPGALSIDYLIGDPAARGRGVGAAMIGAFVAGELGRVPGRARRRRAGRRRQPRVLARARARGLQPDRGGAAGAGQPDRSARPRRVPPGATGDLTSPIHPPGIRLRLHRSG